MYVFGGELSSCASRASRLGAVSLPLAAFVPASASSPSTPALLPSRSLSPAPRSSALQTSFAPPTPPQTSAGFAPSPATPAANVLPTKKVLVHSHFLRLQQLHPDLRQLPLPLPSAPSPTPAPTAPPPPFPPARAGSPSHSAATATLLNQHVACRDHRVPATSSVNTSAVPAHSTPSHSPCTTRYATSRASSPPSPFNSTTASSIHLLTRHQHRLDLPQINAHPPHLYFTVDPPQILDLAILLPPSQIPRPVQPRRPSPAQSGSPQTAPPSTPARRHIPRQPAPPNVDLSAHSHRHRIPLPVQHIHLACSQIGLPIGTVPVFSSACSVTSCQVTSAATSDEP